VFYAHWFRENLSVTEAELESRKEVAKEEKISSTNSSTKTELVQGVSVKFNVNHSSCQQSNELCFMGKSIAARLFVKYIYIKDTSY
jgi:hypothetical protein